MGLVVKSGVTLNPLRYSSVPVFNSWALLTGCVYSVDARIALGELADVFITTFLDSVGFERHRYTPLMSVNTMHCKDKEETVTALEYRASMVGWGGEKGGK